MRMMFAGTSIWLLLDALVDAGVISDRKADKYRHDHRGKVRDADCLVCVDGDSLREDA